ncbi:MAG: hypothetical protein P1V51_03205 [Deltaproteobacteria bacterium]|nr:hypothetical protein [Deltaproteobacteria bacterium]
MCATSIRTCTASAPRALFLALPLVLLLAAGCPPGEGDPDGGGSDSGPAGSCQWDDSTDPGSAADLALATQVDGWLCPIEDEDWYRFTMAPGDHLVGVSLCMGDCQPDSLSPVEPTYAIHTREASGVPGNAVAAPPAEDVGGSLDIVHCMAPGDYFLVVRDQNDDAQDIRRPYHLTVTSAPDPDGSEPNDDAGAATALAANTPVNGNVACRGDSDWYRVNVPAGNVLRVQLQSEVATYQPTFRLEDASGNVVVTISNPAGALRATELDRLVAVTQPGDWYVVVSDDDGSEADPDVPYTLTVGLVPDNDPNEPNNHAGEPTDLAAQTCGAGWSPDIVLTGTFGAAGDNDWFRIPLSGCANGVIEAEVELNTGSLSNAEAWALQEEVQAAVSLIRPHVASPCSDHAQCVSLTKTCGDNYDCAGLFNSCMPDGFCAGSGSCLRDGQCGATVIQRQYSSSTPGTGAPPPNRAMISAPLFGDNYVYVKASDFQANGAAPDVTYTLRIRVRRDPDTHEPSNVYTHRIEQGDSSSLQLSRASGVPVHDCTVGDCCNSGNWVTGALSYEMDQDWYTYQHPCPASDCTLRFVYDVDPGPADTFVAIYRGSSLWFDRLIPLSGGTQGALVGAYGGDQAGDECFYAFRNHSSYGIQIRDLQNDGADWSSDQTYRFCIEKVSNVCEEPPCKIWTDPNDPTIDLGCGQP